MAVSSLRPIPSRLTFGANAAKPSSQNAEPDVTKTDTFTRTDSPSKPNHATSSQAEKEKEAKENLLRLLMETIRDQRTIGKKPEYSVRDVHSATQKIIKANPAFYSSELFERKGVLLLLEAHERLVEEKDRAAKTLGSDTMDYRDWKLPPHLERS